MIDVKEIRDRAWMYLSPSVADSVGLTLSQLQQFVAGTFVPSVDQLRKLARRMGLREEET